MSDTQPSEVAAIMSGAVIDDLGRTWVIHEMPSVFGSSKWLPEGEPNGDMGSWVKISGIYGPVRLVGHE